MIGTSFATRTTTKSPCVQRFRESAVHADGTSRTDLDVVRTGGHDKIRDMHNPAAATTAATMLRSGRATAAATAHGQQLNYARSRNRQRTALRIVVVEDEDAVGRLRHAGRQRT